MKIQYASDLHLEFADNWRYLRAHPLQVAGEVLVLAGDIGYLGDENYTKHPFWDWVSENYQETIVAMGNHEFYKFYDIGTLSNGTCVEIRKNVHSYYNTAVHLGDTDIIVSTLWAKIPLEEAYWTEQSVSDFHRILYKRNLLDFTAFNQEHERCVTFIKETVRQSDAKTKIAVTHHVPSKMLSSPDFENSKINGAFVAELGDYIADSGIDYWIYGHSHRNIDKRIGRTQCLSNQLGYTFHDEHRDFNPGKFIEIG